MNKMLVMKILEIYNTISDSSMSVARMEHFLYIRNIISTRSYSSSTYQTVEPHKFLSILDIRSDFQWVKR